MRSRRVVRRVQVQFLELEDATRAYETSLCLNIKSLNKYINTSLLTVFRKPPQVLEPTLIVMTVYIGEYCNNVFMTSVETLWLAYAINNMES